MCGAGEALGGPHTEGRGPVRRGPGERPAAPALRIAAIAISAGACAQAGSAAPGRPGSWRTEPARTGDGWPGARRWQGGDPQVGPVDRIVEKSVNLFFNYIPAPERLRWRTLGLRVLGRRPGGGSRRAGIPWCGSWSDRGGSGAAPGVRRRGWSRRRSGGRNARAGTGGASPPPAAPCTRRKGRRRRFRRHCCLRRRRCRRLQDAWLWSPTAPCRHAVWEQQVAAH